MINKISKTETLYLKGIGILLIVCHNFLHWVKPMIGENEFSYSREVYNTFLSAMTLDFGNIIKHLFSYFGHYGVQLFIFCSGYGLTVAYGHKQLSLVPFMKKRILKLYPVFTLAILGLLVYTYVIFGRDFSMQTVTDLLLRYTLLANWIPGKIFVVSGPYWFYAMIIQLYVCFFFLVKLHHRYRYGLVAVMLLSYVIIITTNDFFVAQKLSLYYNFLGNLPVFVFGMLLAYNKDKTYNFRYKAMVLPLIVIFILGQYFEFFWNFSQLAFILIIVPLLLKLSRLSQGKMYAFIVYTGGLAMYMFALNGFLRSPWVYQINKYESDVFIYVFALVFLIIVYVASEVLKRVEQSLVKRFL